MCEFSADRAGLLACGSLNLAIAALVKLVAPEVRTQQEFEQALALLQAQHGEVSNRLAETFQSHPMLIRRVNQLRAYARTAGYQSLQTGMNRNIRNTAAEQQADNKVIRSSLPQQQAALAEKAPEPPPEERWPWLRRQTPPRDPP